MWSNFGNKFNGSCFKDLKRDSSRLFKNFKKNTRKKCSVNSYQYRDALKWGAVGSILTFLIISQVGIPLVIIFIGIVSIFVICSKW